MGGAKKSPTASSRKHSRLKCHVRFAPKADGWQNVSGCPLSAKSRHMQCSNCSLFDHLVGAREQQRRNVETDRFGGGEVDDELKLGGLLDRQIAWFFTLEDTIDIGRGLPISIEHFRPIGHQPSAHCEVAERINCGQAVAGSERNDRFTIGCGEEVWQDEKCAIGFPRNLLDHTFDLVRIVNRCSKWLY